MHQQKHKTALICTVFVLLAFFVLFSFSKPSQQQVLETQHTSSTINPLTGAATSAIPVQGLDSFKISPEILTFSSGEQRDLFVTSSDVITYKIGYYLTEKDFSWVPFELSGTQLTSDWIYGQAESAITFDSSQFSLGTSSNYVAIFSCSLTSDGAAWDCHGDTWMVKSFTAVLGEEGCLSTQCHVANCETCVESCIDDTGFHPHGTAICVNGVFVDLPTVPPSPTGDTVSVCGNGILEEGEQCDGLNLGGQSCSGLDLPGSGLRCSADCMFDTSSCVLDQEPQGNGIRGSYYQNGDFTGLTVERIDSTIDFDWGIGAPVQGLQENGFTVAWEGELVSPSTNTYTFYIEHDDRARLYIGDQLVIDAWQDGGTRESTGAVSLVKDAKYNIRLEYLDSSGTAGVTLSWSNPLMMKEVVPQAYLFGEMQNSAPPEVMITSPADGQEFVLGDSITVRVDASVAEGTIDEVLLYVDGNFAPSQSLAGTGSNNAYTFFLSGLAKGTHNVRAEAINDIGQIGSSELVVFSVGEEVVDIPDGFLPWSDPATWATWGASKPTTGSVVTIPAGAKVILDEDTPALEGVYVDGELHFARKDLDVTADYIIVKGLFQLGEELDKFRQKVTITLTDDFTSQDTEIEMCGTKTLCAMGGKLDIHANIRAPAWTQLADGNTAEVGDTSITLEEPVEWQVGDEIVIVSTDYDYRQAEKRVITSVSSDKRTVFFSEPLQYMHFGEIMDIEGFSVDQRAEVMLLTRDVKIQGDTSSKNNGFGGHVKIVTKHHPEMVDVVTSQTQDELLQQDIWQDLWEDPKYANEPEDMSRVSGVEFYRMGQVGRLGKYPFHWHMVGHFPGSYIKDSSVHESYQRCYTVHGTYDVLLENNVGYDVTGHCYFLESFVERDNTLKHNIGAAIHRFADPSQELLESDAVPSVFWISQPTNHLIENVAAGTEGNGIWIDLRNTGGSSHNELNNEPLGEIRDNTVHSTRSTNPNGGGEPKFDGGGGFFYEGGIGEILRLNAYKNLVGYWAQESSDFELVDSTFTDNHIGVWQRRDGSWNSVYVAHTDNIGTPVTSAEKAAGRSLPDFRKDNPGMISAIMGFYSHSYAVGNTFIGYESDNTYARGALSTGSPNFDAPITTSDSTMIRSNPFVPTVNKKGEGPSRGAVMIDFDGTLTGTGTFQEIRVGEPILTDADAGCVQLGMVNGEPVARCSTRSLRFSGMDKGAATLERNGKIYANTRAQHLPAGEIYRWTTTYTGSGFYTREGYKGEYIVLVLPMNSKPTVSPRANRDTVAEASSISQVTSTSKSETRHLYYWDSSKNELWVRVVTGPKAQNFGQLDGDGTLSPFPMIYGVNIN